MKNSADSVLTFSQAMPEVRHSEKGTAQLMNAAQLQEVCSRQSA